MSPALKELMCAHALVANHISAEGKFCLEVFCGSAVITLSLVMMNIPCICPWDSKFGSQFNVLTCGNVLKTLIEHGRIVCSHFATPCTSMTWARWPQLRSTMSPEGLPGLTAKQRRLVELGNKLLSFTIECCVLLYEHDCYFSIENPEMSWLWLQNEAIMIATLPGVEFVKCYFSN
jgi:hypothetical protein